MHKPLRICESSAIERRFAFGGFGSQPSQSLKPLQYRNALNLGMPGKAPGVLGIVFNNSEMRATSMACAESIARAAQCAGANHTIYSVFIDQFTQYVAPHSMCMAPNLALALNINQAHILAIDLGQIGPDMSKSTEEVRHA